MAAAASPPTGRAKETTRRTNPGRARCAEGARARKKAGMPIVSEPTSVRCRGTKGKGRENTPTRMASKKA